MRGGLSRLRRPSRVTLTTAEPVTETKGSSLYVYDLQICACRIEMTAKVAQAPPKLHEPSHSRVGGSSPAREARLGVAGPAAALALGRLRLLLRQVLPPRLRRRSQRASHHDAAHSNSGPQGATAAPPVDPQSSGIQGPSVDGLFAQCCCSCYCAAF